ncbi:MAG: hypothetical protein ACREFT_08860, partial [Acetobacteraceae bacterium]
MQTPQSDTEQEEKSKGHKPQISPSASSAEAHAEGRLTHGFTLNEVVSEYRALRASVIRCGLPIWQLRIRRRSPRCGGRGGEFRVRLLTQR